MNRIYSRSELISIHKQVVGFVYNDFGTATNWNEYEFNVLHKASCTHIKRMTVTHPKYFFESLDEAEAWLNANRPGKWHKCNTCLL